MLVSRNSKIYACMYIVCVYVVMSLRIASRIRVILIHSRRTKINERRWILHIIPRILIVLEVKQSKVWNQLKIGFDIKMRGILVVIIRSVSLT